MQGVVWRITRNAPRALAAPTPHLAHALFVDAAPSMNAWSRAMRALHAAWCSLTGAHQPARKKILNRKLQQWSKPLRALARKPARRVRVVYERLQTAHCRGWRQGCLARTTRRHASDDCSERPRTALGSFRRHGIRRGLWHSHLALPAYSSCHTRATLASCT